VRGEGGKESLDSAMQLLTNGIRQWGMVGPELRS
jgi:hypothetical protein